MPSLQVPVQHPASLGNICYTRCQTGMALRATAGISEDLYSGRRMRTEQERAGTRLSNGLQYRSRSTGPSRTNQALCACPDARSAPSPFLVVLAVASASERHLKATHRCLFRRAFRAIRLGSGAGPTPSTHHVHPQAGRRLRMSDIGRVYGSNSRDPGGAGTGRDERPSRRPTC